jgi:hypothetical protein
MFARTYPVRALSAAPAYSSAARRAGRDDDGFALARRAACDWDRQTMCEASGMANATILERL